MRWTYSIQNKLTAAAVLFFLGALVLLSNYNDRQHTKQVKDMISTLYQDRLIAEEYIFTLTVSIYKLRELATSEKSPGNSLKIESILAKIASTNSSYKKTKLTENEEAKFIAFENTVSQLSKEINTDRETALARTGVALDGLEGLSDLQLEVSKLIVEKSEQEYQLSKLLSNFAFAIAIILLLFLQALVFSSKTLHISNRNVNANLN
ncbi:hypothetical protein SAMN06298216_2104 [Spirosomataceae bacterium TFI 002]|nr:hypothetical protein SAMN06298216_2104 [Spirosomataceae bacterium TFI 002]